MTTDRESLLSKVRALLSKAESTEHEAEAEAFLAGAQRLIASHAIEQGELSEADRGEILTQVWFVPEPTSFRYTSLTRAVGWSVWSARSSRNRAPAIARSDS